MKIIEKALQAQLLIAFQSKKPELIKLANEKFWEYHNNKNGW